MTKVLDDAAIRAIERPHPNLLKLYVMQALAGTILFPFIMLPLYFRYHTLRYRFDDEGISAKWGILFRREIYLTYKRIQDIHVSRNIFERWLGIGKVEIQTASGSSSAELSLEGMDEYAAVRDYLYGRMRGTTDAPTAEESKWSSSEEELLTVLRELKDEIEGTRRALEARGEPS